MATTKLDKNKIDPSSTGDGKSAQASHHLTADTGLSIHTRRAQSLCQGDWDYRSMGLFQFASVMHIVYQSKFQDDPYADWHIEKIETDLIKIKQAVEIATTNNEQKIQQCRGLQIKIFGSQNPLTLTLNFSNPSAYMAANLIGELDYLLRQAYTFRRLGIFPKTKEITDKLYWDFKTILKKCRQWRHTGVIRQDIREKNQKSERAKSILGKIPSRILNNK